MAGQVAVGHASLINSGQTFTFYQFIFVKTVSFSWYEMQTVRGAKERTLPRRARAPARLCAARHPRRWTCVLRGGHCAHSAACLLNLTPTYLFSNLSNISLSF